MLLGINRVLPTQEMKPGKFYLRPNYNGPPSLFLLATAIVNNDMVWRAVHFQPQDENPVAIYDVENFGPVAELPDVHVRVDAPSLSGTNFNESIRAPMLLVQGDEVYVVGSTGWRGHMVVRISDGEIVDVRPDYWAAFSRWQLVIEEAGEEIPIANFGV